MFYLCIHCSNLCKVTLNTYFCESETFFGFRSTNASLLIGNVNVNQLKHILVKIAISLLFHTNVFLHQHTVLFLIVTSLRGNYII